MLLSFRKKKKGLVLFAAAMAILGCNRKQEVFQIGEFFPENDRFWEVIPRDAVVERIGIAFEFTEGPAWHPGGFLIFSDIPGNTIYRWTGKKYIPFVNPVTIPTGYWQSPMAPWFSVNMNPEELPGTPSKEIQLCLLINTGIAD